MLLSPTLSKVHFALLLSSMRRHQIISILPPAEPVLLPSHFSGVQCCLVCAAHHPPCCLLVSKVSCMEWVSPPDSRLLLRPSIYPLNVSTWLMGFSFNTEDSIKIAPKKGGDWSTNNMLTKTAGQELPQKLRPLFSSLFSSFFFLGGAMHWWMGMRMTSSDVTKVHFIWNNLTGLQIMFTLVLRPSVNKPWDSNSSSGGQVTDATASETLNTCSVSLVTKTTASETLNTCSVGQVTNTTPSETLNTCSVGQVTDTSPPETLNTGSGQAIGKTPSKTHLWRE